MEQVSRAWLSKIDHKIDPTGWVFGVMSTQANIFKCMIVYSSQDNMHRDHWTPDGTGHVRRRPFPGGRKHKTATGRRERRVEQGCHFQSSKRPLLLSLRRRCQRSIFLSLFFRHSYQCFRHSPWAWMPSWQPPARRHTWQLARLSMLAKHANAQTHRWNRWICPCRNPTQKCPEFSWPAHRAWSHNRTPGNKNSVAH